MAVDPWATDAEAEEQLRIQLAGRSSAGLALALVASVIALGLVAISSLNPLLAGGITNGLELKCSEAGLDGTAEYDRSSWTPLLWSCTVDDGHGGTRRITP